MGYFLEHLNLQSIPKIVVIIKLQMVVSTTNFKTKKYYKMKRILLVIFCFALITKAIGQTADRIELDKIYQHISRTAIPTGYLNSFPTTSPFKLCELAKGRCGNV